MAPTTFFCKSVEALTDQVDGVEDPKIMEEFIFSSGGRKRAYGDRTLSITHELMRGVSCGVRRILEWYIRDNMLEAVNRIRRRYYVIC